jgi:hypothetical protein
MKTRILLPILWLGLAGVILGQAKEVFDILSFRTPAGWRKEVQSNAVQLGAETPDGGICLVTIFKAVPAGSDPKSNFNAAWENVVKEVVTVTGRTQMNEPATENGWVVESGAATYESDGKQGVVVLVAISGGGKMVNILMLANTTAFEDDFGKLLESISLPPVKAENQPVVRETVDAPVMNKKSGFHFNTTNFDDGWTAVEQEAWVRVYNQEFSVLLHYPRKEESEYIPQQRDTIRRFWDLLIAPRYGNLRNFEMLDYNNSYEPGYFAAGDVTDNQTGKNVYVVLFSKGRSGWIEFIAPNRDAFVRHFKVSRPDSLFSGWEPLAKMAGYNKFAVAAGDLNGKWTSDFGSATSYYNVYSGIYLGTNTYNSVQSFTFGANQSYKWVLVVARGSAGGMNVDKGDSAGKYTLAGNWNIDFSNIDGRRKNYEVRFSCIKGGRILWIDGTPYAKAN